MNDKLLDCVIMGGGPAGATVATVLAQHGQRVRVLEKAWFPRPHIGESLVPHTYWTFERIGMLDKLRRTDFPRKQSVQFINALGNESQPFYFPDFDPGEHSTTWQVPRPEFDKLMLDNAREHGVEVTEGAIVGRVLFEGQRAVGVQAVVDGVTLEIPAKVVVDATGQSTLLSRQLKLRQADDKLKNSSIYGYYRGALRDSGRNAGATVIIYSPNGDGWFWSIPLADDLTSVGLVAPSKALWSGAGDDPQTKFQEAIRACPGMASRLVNASQIGGVTVTKDFSYRASRVAGDGWVLIGDAFGFLDPIYSSGVMLALKSGELAADTIHEALEADDLSGERLGRFAPQLTDGMQTIRQLVHAFYDPNFSFAKFSRDYPQYKEHIVRILIGDVFNDEVGKVFEVLRSWIDLPEPIPLQSG
ncbi:MAG: tryptophan 7-halogenase, partial [Planctomycetes bacterium]|nr:tryptophan 7-halogenase [Planctomycetota bacterium]